MQISNTEVVGTLKLARCLSMGLLGERLALASKSECQAIPIHTYEASSARATLL
jgi:hypothetical protein